MTAADERASTYLIGNGIFQVRFGSLAEVAADALGSSDDNYLSMGGGVSAALSLAGGPQVGADAYKHLPLALGDVAVTTAGNLPAKYIFHGVTIDYDRITGPDSDCVRQIVVRCLALAEALRLRHAGGGERARGHRGGDRVQRGRDPYGQGGADPARPDLSVTHPPALNPPVPGPTRRRRPPRRAPPRCWPPR